MFFRHKNTRINIITCTDCRGGIGKNNKMPWNCKEDMAFFKNMTTNNIVIMGRKTFESINNNPLKNRINIVLSKTIQKDNDLVNNVYYCKYIEEAMNICKSKEYRSKEIFIIGGEKIYSLFISKYEKNKEVDIKIYMTNLYNNYECDTFFNFNIFKYNILYKTPLHKFYCKINKEYLDFDIRCYAKKT